ncbi:MAG: addiction module protein [Thiobacillus sp.]
MEVAMSLTAEQIKAEAMKLPPEERADLADWLWVSATPREEVKAAWDAEIARRIAEIDAGTVELIPSEEVFARIDEKLRKAGA